MLCGVLCSFMDMKGLFAVFFVLCDVLCNVMWVCWRVGGSVAVAVYDMRCVCVCVFVFIMEKKEEKMQK